MKASGDFWLWHDICAVLQQENDTVRLIQEEIAVLRLRMLQRWWRENVRGRYLGEV